MVETALQSSGGARGMNQLLRIGNALGVALKQLKLYQVDAFTTEKLKGNPAGVVCNADSLSDVQMQSVAR
jgi:hypothetical protein